MTTIKIIKTAAIALVAATLITTMFAGSASADDDSPGHVRASGACGYTGSMRCVAAVVMWNRSTANAVRPGSHPASAPASAAHLRR
jgi:hypothetical protein